VCREDVERFCLWVKDLCGFREVRTPTSREFEYMVRGGAGSDYLFSWGQEFEPNQCNDIFWGGHKGTAPYDAFERSRELKLWDLCGNVTEWLHDAAPKKAGYFQVAGASFRRVALYWGHASARGLAAAYTASDEVGFRIVVND
jgi:formylglycine-generating enzyme required for sulfatase activity